MRLDRAIVSALGASQIANGLLVVPPAPQTADVVARQPPVEHTERDTASSSPEELWKRRGGGGGGGRGGGGGGSRGGGGGNSGSGSGSSGRGSPSSNAGGRTTTGSGPPPAYGGGKYYGGGAVQPLKPGTRTASGINPVLLGVGLGALAFWPGLWLYGAYSYHYNNPYRFHNETHDPPENQTKPIICACDPYMPCGCDENGDQAYLNDLIGNGSYSHLNHTLITVANVNGTETILINGTLPNGTTAAGGTEDPYSAGTGMQLLLENAGWWPLLATVGAAVFLG